MNTLGLSMKCLSQYKGGISTADMGDGAAKMKSKTSMRILGHLPLAWAHVFEAHWAVITFGTRDREPLAPRLLLPV
jgi:hypothetical protein